ncbi:MAG: hypothetical protein VKL42_12485 [Snowella sp.]|nr:hypothetical protein [Snowella sp.]
MDYYPQSSRPNYPRVTKILEATENAEDKERLRKWQHKMNSIADKKGSPTANQITEEAADKGTVFHEAIKNYLSKGKEPHFSSLSYRTLCGDEQLNRWNNALPYLKIIKPNVLCVEQEVFSDKLQYIGHLDCLAWDGKKLILPDWKTSARFKKRAWIERHFIQGAAYAIAAYECGVAPIVPSEIHIYIFSPNKAQLFIEDFAKFGPIWLERLKQFKALKESEIKIPVIA